MYTLHPKDEFALAESFSPPDSDKPRRTFRGEVFRGHLERSPHDIVLSDVTVQIKRVIYKHEFSPKEKRTENLEYVLFGTPDELFLAHRIIPPGDFDQLPPVRISGQQFSDTDLSKGLRIVVSGRPNTSAGPSKRSE
jgi:hypothetical protein